MSARRLLHRQQEQDGDSCLSCGQMCAGKPLGIGDSFTTIQQLRLLPGDTVCSGCAGLLGDAQLRYSGIVANSEGLTRVKREEMWPSLTGQQGDFVATWPISRKKHCWLYAGLSTPEEWQIGSDAQTVVFNLREHGPAQESVFHLLNLAIPQSNICSGQYHPKFLSQYLPQIEQAENLIANHRASGLVEFLVYIGPRVKSPLEERIETMIDPADELAAKFLSLIAGNSDYRINQGMDFWGGFFAARIERVRNLPLADQASRLMQSLLIPAHGSGVIAEFLNDITAEETKQIEQSISRRPKLVIALAYSALKEKKMQREKIKQKPPTPQPAEPPAEPDGGLFA
jgi:hypothetical protein